MTEDGPDQVEFHTMAAENEGKCLDAVLRILEDQHGAKQRILERDTPANPGIELLCDVGGQRYALEHTLIEPFPENQRDNIAFSKVLGDIEAAVGDLCKPDLVYKVYVDVYAFANMKGRQLESVRHQLISWLRASIPSLSTPIGPRQTSIRGAPPEAPVPVTLSCHRSKLLERRLLAGRFAPDGLDDLRRRRLRKALQDKNPKLRAAKQPGTCTVLVLENNDVALTNESVISEAVDRLSREAAYMPDEIYLVGTYIPNHFYVTQIRHTSLACLVMGDDKSQWEFDAESLNEI